MHKEYKYVAMAKDVLVVAVLTKDDEGDLFDWAAYCKAVPGINHDKEFKEVAREGDKLPKEWVSLFFPNIPLDNYRL